MPWVLAWATWHHSVQPLSNSSFPSDIQGNENRISGREKGGIRFFLAGGEGRKQTKARPGQSTPESSPRYALIWPPTSCDPCIPRVSSVLRDKPTLPSLSRAALMSARGHEVNDWADLPADKWSPGGTAEEKLKRSLRCVLPEQLSAPPSLKQIWTSASFHILNSETSREPSK